jgi:hypothetical protein
MKKTTYLGILSFSAWGLAFYQSLNVEGFFKYYGYIILNVIMWFYTISWFDKD